MLEVLLVIGLLVALFALVAPELIGRQKKAQIGATKLQIGNIEQGLEYFRADMGRYPTTDEGLEALTNPSQIQDEELAKKWTEPYLKKGGVKDSWNTPFNYECPGRHNEKSFDLWSNGPDRREGTDDDITNWTNDPPPSR
jgi:general secretion pathway protein G